MKTVLVTGATSGFGFCMVEEFLKRGDRVIATGRNLSTRPALFKTLQEQYREQLMQMDLDVCRPEQIEALAQLVGRGEPGLDVLINNAGYGLFGALEDISESQIREQFEVNFFGGFKVIQALLPAIRKNKGRIFNFSSVLGYVALPLSSAYCASKYAIEGLTESLYHELRPQGVQVCLIEPGSFKTSFGQKMIWGQESFNLASVYHLQTKIYEKVRLGFNKNAEKTDPRSVALGVVALSRQKRMPLRRRFGQDARMAWWLRQFLPDTWFLWLMTVFVEYNFHRGLKK